MSQERDPLTTELAHLVHQVADRLRAEFRRAAGRLELPVTQAALLARLEEPTPMRALAEVLSCDASHVTGIVDGLERRGLVERRAAPKDRRVKLVALTDEGRRRRAELAEIHRSYTASVFALPEEERRALRELLGRVAAGLDAAR
ncbi:winged helix DNA-binding protein [Streptomyces sp. 3MP-14]|uniref:Winged helix DNA-binding protein n=1 Tax=Streptomyces mimosae TaxID=2586635 RepID=A0A5N6AM97_9ACTN|nr:MULTISPECIES: MarR family transcriptional regulator [Streptomyces]KAB8168819.1 winged helix DNA-binding protein [Streptomyces mimosae]KAB8177901.1 winged helix DNA-binding protein [Streptomyces sp. 3MP-14]